MEHRDDLMSGIWKFSMDRVTPRQLGEYAEELAQKEEYLHVYIRKASKDQWGLGFALKHNKGGTEEYDKLLEDLKDELYKRFGSGLVGWDISSSTYTVKGF